MTDLFTGDPDPVIDPAKDYYTDLVGADKKFKTPQELARAKAEADAFIERLKTEAAGLRTDLSQRQRLEELIDKLKPSQPNPNPNPDNNQPSGEGENRTALTPEQIEELVAKSVDKRDQARTQQTNLETVKQALTAHFGSDFAAPLNAEASKLGLSKDFVNQLAATQPQAFLKMFGIGKKATSENLFSQPASSITASSAGVGVRNYAYYEKIRKTNPSEFWQPKVQNQLHKDAQELGEYFYA